MEDLTISKHVFDDWWTSTYIDRITPLLAQEIEALVDYHWRELQGTAIRHSLRETKAARKRGETMQKEDEAFPKKCTCIGASYPNDLGNWHLNYCPLYQP